MIAAMLGEFRGSDAVLKQQSLRQPKIEQSQWEGKHPEPKSRVDERKVVATVKLAAPVCNLLEFKLDCSPSTKISFIVDRIIDRHGGSISDLSVCVNRFHPEEIVGRDKTLEQCGVFGGECLIYYDFVPRAGALLA
ncbi:unnamed protein product [Effrenium voratum]|nr:unnamed protein product [Effrenium voratum]